MKRDASYKLCAALLTTLLASSGNAETKTSDLKTPVEKCYGVSKAGKNDCAAKDKSSSCAGHATKDRDPNHWIYLPKGLCDKLADGVKE